MPQLDKFPLLFHFKSFILIFLFIYMFFLFIVLPLIHISLRLRKLLNSSLLFSNIILEFEIMKLSYLILTQIKNLSLMFVKLNDLFLNTHINKQIKKDEFV